MSNPSGFKTFRTLSRDSIDVEGVIERIRIDDVHRSRRELQIVKIALDHVSIFLSRIQIDPDREAAEIEKSLHLGADPGRQAKDRPARPDNIQRGQSFAQGRPEFRIVIREIVGFELRLLVFQVRFVGSVTAVLKSALRVPFVAELAKEDALPDRTLQSGEEPQRIEGAFFVSAHQQS